MAKTPKTSKPSESKKPQAEQALWQGTGLCCEAQADGVPCGGTAGECEACGKALPPKKA